MCWSCQVLLFSFITNLCCKVCYFVYLWYIYMQRELLRFKQEARNLQGVKVSLAYLQTPHAYKIRPLLRIQLVSDWYKAEQIRYASWDWLTVLCHHSGCSSAAYGCAGVLSPAAQTGTPAQQYDHRRAGGTKCERMQLRPNIFVFMLCIFILFQLYHIWD